VARIEFVKSTDNESFGGKLDTSKSVKSVVMMGLRRRGAQALRIFWLPNRPSGTFVKDDEKLRNPMTAPEPKPSLVWRLLPSTGRPGRSRHQVSSLKHAWDGKRYAVQLKYSTYQSIRLLRIACHSASPEFVRARGSA
jgi:hypothetical protein